MPDGELDPDNPNVVEYGPNPDGVTVDVEDDEQINVELFGAAGDSNNEGAGGRVIARGYDVSDVDELKLYVADGRFGRLDGGEGANDGGGLTALERDGDVEIAAHGGGGDGALNAGGGGGGAAGGIGGDGTITGSDGEDGESGAGVSDLGGDGVDESQERDGAHAGAGELLAENRVSSFDVFKGGGNSEHKGVARIEFAGETSITITETNTPVAIGDTVEVDVDVTNESDLEQTITVVLEVDPA